jgi:protein-S-isoprenylcysteine O-methyltransferase Ste14
MLEIVLKNSIFLIVFISGMLYLIGLILTIIYPKIRIWPPPGRNTWQYMYVNIFGSILVAGIPILGLLDWDSIGNEFPMRFFFGVPMIIIAFLVSLWSIKTLSINQSLGLKGKFITRGPYQYSRNPQYVSYLFLIIGLIITTNSIMALIIGLVAMFWFLIAPFSEEPWLLQQFGSEYQEYKNRVPRFIGIRTCKKIRK